jgi:hypothetical protein
VIGRLLPPKKPLRLREVNNRPGSETPEAVASEGLVFLECVERAVRKRVDRVELLYRASEGGFDSKGFKAACKGETDTLVLVRSNKDRVFGGYSPCAWPASD